MINFHLNRYESNENIVITCSTKVCSFGKQVVEKVETEYSRLESSRFIYRIQRSPMCEYMINFIQKLKGLPERYMMNSVLENFTILQVSWLYWIRSPLQQQKHERILLFGYSDHWIQIPHINFEKKRIFFTWFFPW